MEGNPAEGSEEALMLGGVVAVNELRRLQAMDSGRDSCFRSVSDRHPECCLRLNRSDSFVSSGSWAMLGQQWWRSILQVTLV